MNDGFSPLSGAATVPAYAVPALQRSQPCRCATNSVL